MKKLFLLFVTFVATTSLWAHDFEVDGIYYNYLNGNNVEVTYKGNSYADYNNEYSGAVSIPETVTYNGTTYGVTSIGNWAFANCTSLSSISIPDSVTHMEKCAFIGCSSLTSITIPCTIKNIGENAFQDCSSLTAITYEGSRQQWSEIEFGSNWNIDIPAKVVHCTDGDVKLSGLFENLLEHL